MVRRPTGGGLTRWLAIALFTLPAHAALAQNAGDDKRMQAEAGVPAEKIESHKDAKPEGSPAASDQPLPGPKYLGLRYNEDFSYLDGPDGSYQPDFFDPIKNIHLSDDLTLSVGGSVRGRLEAITNPTFGSAEPAQDTYFLHRYFIHTDLRYRKLVRVYFEGVNAMIEDRDLPLLGIHENRWDFHQLFLDVRPLGENTPLTLRVGRQELLYGAQRLISPLDWANTRRRFDGVKLFYSDKTFDLDVFYVRPIPIDLSEGLNRKPDEYREEEHFYGIYGAYKGIPDHYVELYLLGLHDTGDLRNANGRIGDRTLLTAGGRVGGKSGGFDYDGELMGQWGTFAGDTIRAWGAAVDAGYTFKEVSWKPRIGAGFDYGSGDDDPTDGAHETFNQLFPLGHAYLGYLDLFARQNVIATNINLTAKPHEKIVAKLEWMTFWNDSEKDALYNAGGGIVRRDPTGRSGHDIGNELDLTIKYQLDVHSSMLFGYSHFWGNNFIKTTGPSQDADFIYVQYELKF
ncbi:MAG: alginate export family protein [Phycisphaerales bacterium]|nr:alginate export family protein [Phycisphaerales bacterium]MCB9856889.1 alginate export family protein [Phycisphaerales bacterium]MCB9861984.1 alginate export family protein [Phycisphaerales bacterium]